MKQSTLANRAERNAKRREAYALKKNPTYVIVRQSPPGRRIRPYHVVINGWNHRMRFYTAEYVMSWRTLASAVAHAEELAVRHGIEYRGVKDSPV